MYKRILTYDKSSLIRSFLSVWLIFSSCFAFSQTLTPKEWEAIQKSNNYIIGMGVNAIIECNKHGYV